MSFLPCSQSFPSVSIGKVFVPKLKPIEIHHEEVTTLDPELEEALSSATDTELCDLAGELKKYLLRKLKDFLKHNYVFGSLFVLYTQC